MFLMYSGDCKDFVDQLQNGLEQKGILTYRNDIQLSGPSNNEKYHEYLDKAYEDSRFSIKIAYENDLYLSFCRNIPHLPKDGSFGGAKAHQWMTDLLYPTTIPGKVFETTNGYQSSIAKIIKRIREILRKESSGTGRKGFELISFLEKRLAIFWDIESSPFPTNLNPEDIAIKIMAFVERETKTNWEAVDVNAYGHSSAEQKKKLQSIGRSLAERNVKLHYSGVTLIHTPQHGRKDTTYIALLVDMFKRSHYCPPPSSIMLITGNISYANALHALWLLGHKIILVTSSKVGVSVSLMNASVYTWPDVPEGTSSSQGQIKELLDDNNNWPGSNLVKREDATSSSQCQELRMRCEEFVSIDPSDSFFIFWDLENCPIPGEVPAKDVALYILTFVTGKIKCSSPTGKIDCSSSRIRAYGDFSRILDGATVRKSLEESGVNVINTPHVKKDAADEAMMIDLFMYSKLVPSPSSIMVITGDVDFATTLHAIGGFGHDIYLAIPSWVDVSESLTSAFKDKYWYWSEVAYGIDLTALKGQLEDLLKINDGQLRLGSLGAEYQKMFNKPLCVSDYKSDNLVNLLNRMSYMISVEVKLKGDEPSSSKKMIKKETEIDYDIKDLFEETE